jgi:hypothetical protein
LKSKGLVEVEGEIQNYQGEFEIVVEEIAAAGLDAG